MKKRYFIYFSLAFLFLFSFGNKVHAFGREEGYIFNLIYNDTEIKDSIDFHFNRDNESLASTNFSYVLDYIESGEWKSYGDTYFTFIDLGSETNTVRFYIGSKEAMEQVIFVKPSGYGLSPVKYDLSLSPRADTSYNTSSLIYQAILRSSGDNIVELFKKGSYGSGRFVEDTYTIFLTNMDKFYYRDSYDQSTFITKSNTMFNQGDIVFYKQDDGTWKFNDNGWGSEYKLDKTYKTSDVFGFFYNRLGLTDPAKLKIVYIPNNGVMPVINRFNIKEKGPNDTTFYDYETTGLMMDNFTSYITFDSNSFKSLNTYQVFPMIENWADLDGTFYLYGNREALALGAFDAIYFENTNLYVVSKNELLPSVEDVLISPSELSYKIYLPEKYYNNLLFYKFNIDNQFFVREFYPINYTHGYYEYNIELSTSEYLRIVNLTDNSYNFYSTADWLHISSVLDNHAEVIKPGESQPTDVDVGSVKAPDSESSKHKTIVSELKKALDWFYDIFVFIFSMISAFYNSMPVQFRYFCILSFFFFIAFLFMRIV